MIYRAIINKRAIRLFKQDKLDYEILEKCIDAARLSSSARNLQPLEYIVIDDSKLLKSLLPMINFGGFISEDKKARKGFEPAALIVMVVRQGSEDYYKYDVGIAAQNISLVAFENGIGSCMMGSIDKEQISKRLNVPDDYFVGLVIALGYPEEQPIVEEAGSKTGYYRENDVLHVPKRTLKGILHRNRF
ncbi:nitroreductase family protein [Candidatus Woesearchaeota archaeon]|nr:nitroreductase family protein [Candidatus Woesearchaeota archaeon]